MEHNNYLREIRKTDCPHPCERCKKEEDEKMKKIIEDINTHIECRCYCHTYHYNCK